MINADFGSRYVGAEAAEDDDEPFAEKMQRLAATLEEQFAEAAVTLHEIRRLRKVRPHMLYLMGDSAHRIVLKSETLHVSPTL